MDDELIAKLERWVEKHPLEADLPAMNITTGKTFTTKEILKELKKGKETGFKSLDNELLEASKQIENWIRGVKD